MIDYDQMKRYTEQDVIEVAPLAYMRGRTLNEAFIILDEAQNTTVAQMKMFLTRMGRGSKIVVSGDTTQIDLPPHTRSGLIDALRRLRGIDGLTHVALTNADIVRHRLVQDIVRAYEEEDGRNRRMRSAECGVKTPRSYSASASAPQSCPTAKTSHAAGPSCAGTAAGQALDAPASTAQPVRLWRMVLAVFAAIALWAVNAAWAPPFGFRLGDVPRRDLQAAVLFTEPNPAATEDARQKAREEARYVYAQNAGAVGAVAGRTAQRGGGRHQRHDVRELGAVGRGGSFTLRWPKAPLP